MPQHPDNEVRHADRDAPPEQFHGNSGVEEFGLRIPPGFTGSNVDGTIRAHHARRSPVPKLAGQSVQVPVDGEREQALGELTRGKFHEPRIGHLTYGVNHAA